MVTSQKVIREPWQQLYLLAGCLLSQTLDKLQSIQASNLEMPSWFTLWKRRLMFPSITLGSVSDNVLFISAPRAQSSHILALRGMPGVLCACPRHKALLAELLHAVLGPASHRQLCTGLMCCTGGTMTALAFSPPQI